MKGLEIRHARIEDCPALGRIIVNATQDAFRGRVPDQCLNWLTSEESAANWAKNFKTEQSLDVGDYLFVAETTSSRVVGLAMLSKITPEDGYKSSILKEYAYELRSIQVDPEWQRQGIGQLLVSRAADELRQKMKLIYWSGYLLIIQTQVFMNIWELFDLVHDLMNGKGIQPKRSSMAGKINENAL